MRRLLIALPLLLVSCGTHPLHLPAADSMRIEPAGIKIDSPAHTSKIIAFLHSLPGSWSRPWNTPRSGGFALLFESGGKPTATIHVAGHWICVAPATGDRLENTLSSADRTTLDKLLTEAKNN